MVDNNDVYTGEFLDELGEKERLLDCSGVMDGQDAREPHPMIGALIGNHAVEMDPISIDTLDDLYQKERYHRSWRFICSQYSRPDLSPLDRVLAHLYEPMHSVDSIGNQFSTKVIPCFMKPDVDTALEAFRLIRPNTVKEEMVLLANDEQFRTMHGNLEKHLNELDDEMRNTVKDRLEDIKAADRNQFNDDVDRSLEIMLKRGMIITIDPNNADAIIESGRIAGEGILPVTEYLKNDKVLNISGFEGAKISLAVHDFMDHIWTFDTLRNSGIFEKFSDMFDSIGNPETTDIYKREGEAIASIAFGVRYFQTMPSAFGPIFRSSQIETQYDEMLKADELTERHWSAYRNIKTILRGSMEWQSLGFDFSNYITELDEQRRVYGKIKQRDPKTRRVYGELNPFSADYLSFFIEAHKQIVSPTNKHRNDLLRFHILLEEYLSSFAKGDIPADESLTIRLDELRGIDFSKTTLPPKRIQWMNNNYGFTATRDAII